MRFAGRVALVTGGGSGIGRATALRLAGEGATVCVADLDADRAAVVAGEIGVAGGQAFPRAVDVSRRADVDALMASVVAQAGQLDILVNAAGLLGPNKPTWEWTEAEADLLLGVNLKGVLFCLQAGVEPMLARGRGAIVSIASVAGKEGNPNQCIYAASKAAVISLTKSLAKEVAGRGIRVNCVSPALIETSMAAQLPDGFRQNAVERIPLGRPGRPEEVASVIAFLCSDDASFVTGQNYDISGGRSVY